jgi:anti-anti-sigma factor
MVDFARWLHVEYVNGTALITFPSTDLGEGEAFVIGGELSELAERTCCRRFVVNLGAIHGMSSTMIGKLIGFQKKVRQRGGDVTLCSLSPELAARLECMRLDRLFHICSTEEAALGEVPAGAI